jgi:signal transduction histidine kinase
VVAAGLLAVGLGWYIPSQVEARFLEAQVEADQAVLDVLLTTKTLVPKSAESVAALDAFIRQAVVRGDFARAKLWDLDGTILYSDEGRLIGRSFDPDGSFEEAVVSKEPVSEVSGLQEPENQFEQVLGARLLETYLPVLVEGEVVAVWEVYRPLDRLDAAVERVRTAVWISVAIGLGLLALFLVSAYGGLISSVQRRRRDAEARSRELTTLLDLARATLQTHDPGVLAEDTVRLVYASGSYDYVRLSSASDGESDVLSEAGDPLGDRPDGGDWDSATANSLSDRESFRLEGRVNPAGPTPPSPTLLQAALEEYRIGIDRASLYRHLEDSRSQLADLMQRLVDAQEVERQRIVGEVHDGLGQDLHRILFGLRGSRSASDVDMRQELAVLEDVVADSSRRLRRLLQELHPSTIDDIGLVASLQGLVERMHEDYGLNVDLHLDLPEEPEIQARLALFRIAQEALRNVVKHADTLAADLRIRRENGFVELRIADAGRGSQTAPAPGLGLWLMAERARSVGGTMEFETGAAGSSVTARIPAGPS